MLMAIGIYLAIGAWLGCCVVAIAFEWPIARWFKVDVNEADRILVREEILANGVWREIGFTTVFWLPILLIGVRR